MALTVGTTIASAAATESHFPPRRVRDLIEICAPASEDPKMTAAINYGHGLAQGAVLVEEPREAPVSGRRLFCLPSPSPAEASEITRFFIAWANALPSRLDEPAIDGMFIYSAGARKTESAMRRLILAGVVAALPLAGCADMTQSQQRALSGRALGAGGGAVIGAIAGNAGLGAGIGAVAGLAGGLIFDKV